MAERSGPAISFFSICYRWWFRLQSMKSTLIDEVCRRCTTHTRSFSCNCMHEYVQCHCMAQGCVVSACTPRSYHPCLCMSVRPRCLVVVPPLCLSLPYLWPPPWHLLPSWLCRIWRFLRRSHETRCMALWPYPHLWHKMCHETRVNDQKKFQYWAEIQTVKLLATSWISWLMSEIWGTLIWNTTTCQAQCKKKTTHLTIPGKI